MMNRPKIGRRTTPYGLHNIMDFGKWYGWEISAKICEIIRYAGLGHEHKCGAPATYILDQHTEFALRVCDDCATEIHPSRLTPIQDA